MKKIILTAILTGFLVPMTCWAADNTLRTLIRKKHLKTITQFLKTHPAISLNDPNTVTGNSYLHESCKKIGVNQSAIAKIFINKTTINLQNEKRETALMLACKTAFLNNFPMESIALIHMLLKNGAKPNIINKNGTRAIDNIILGAEEEESQKCYLAQMNQGHILALLLLHGADLAIENDCQPIFSLLKRKLKWFARVSLFSDLIPIKKKLGKLSMIKLKEAGEKPSLIEQIRAQFIPSKKRLNCARVRFLNEIVLELSLFDKLPPRIEKQNALYQKKVDFEIAPLVNIANAFMSVYFDSTLINSATVKDFLNKEENNLCLQICYGTPFETISTLRKKRLETTFEHRAKTRAHQLFFAHLGAEFSVIANRSTKTIHQQKSCKNLWDIKILSTR